MAEAPTRKWWHKQRKRSGRESAYMIVGEFREIVDNKKGRRAGDDGAMDVREEDGNMMEKGREQMVELEWDVGCCNGFSKLSKPRERQWVTFLFLKPIEPMGTFWGRPCVDALIVETLEHFLSEDRHTDAVYTGLVTLARPWSVV